MAYLALSPTPKARPSRSAGHSLLVANSAANPMSASAQQTSSGTSVEMSPADSETPGTVANARAERTPVRTS